jgi:hypothetical protein
MQLEGGDGLGGRWSCSVTGVVGGSEVQGRGRESSRERDGTSGGKKRKEGKKKKKKGRGEGRWGAGQLGPTSQFPTCGIVPRQKR